MLFSIFQFFTMKNNLRIQFFFNSKYFKKTYKQFLSLCIIIFEFYCLVLLIKYLFLFFRGTQT